MEDSQFIAALTVTQFVLSFLGTVITTLQSTACNLAAAYHDVALAQECIRDSRNEECWKKLWATTVLQIASAVGISISKPRSVGQQLHRANAGAVDQSPSDYYRINVYYPFIDHVVDELETRFSSDHEGLIVAQYLILQHLQQLSQGKIVSLEDYYGKYLTYKEKELLHVEIAKWKKCYEGMPIQERPKTATSALVNCSPQSFPALHKILTIFLTTPVGSVSCERSFSSLRRLKLWTCS